MLNINWGKKMSRRNPDTELTTQETTCHRIGKIYQRFTPKQYYMGQITNLRDRIQKIKKIFSNTENPQASSFNSKLKSIQNKKEDLIKEAIKQLKLFISEPDEALNDFENALKTLDNQYLVSEDPSLQKLPAPQKMPAQNIFEKCLTKLQSLAYKESLYTELQNLVKDESSNVIGEETQQLNFAERTLTCTINDQDDTDNQLLKECIETYQKFLRKNSIEKRAESIYQLKQAIKKCDEKLEALKKVEAAYGNKSLLDHLNKLIDDYNYAGKRDKIIQDFKTKAKDLDAKVEDDKLEDGFEQAVVAVKPDTKQNSSKFDKEKLNNLYNECLAELNKLDSASQEKHFAIKKQKEQLVELQEKLEGTKNHLKDLQSALKKATTPHRHETIMQLAEDDGLGQGLDYIGKLQKAEQHRDFKIAIEQQIPNLLKHDEGQETCVVDPETGEPKKGEYRFAHIKLPAKLGSPVQINTVNGLIDNVNQTLQELDQIRQSALKDVGYYSSHDRNKAKNQISILASQLDRIAQTLGEAGKERYWILKYIAMAENNAAKIIQRLLDLQKTTAKLLGNSLRHIHQIPCPSGFFAINADNSKEEVERFHKSMQIIYFTYETRQVHTQSGPKTVYENCKIGRLNCSVARLRQLLDEFEEKNPNCVEKSFYGYKGSKLPWRSNTNKIKFQATFETSEIKMKFIKMVEEDCAKQNEDKQCRDDLKVDAESNSPSFGNSG
jgi:hypothetical protein